MQLALSFFPGLNLFASFLPIWHLWEALSKRAKALILAAVWDLCGSDISMLVFLSCQHRMQIEFLKALVGGSREGMLLSNVFWKQLMLDFLILHSLSSVRELLGCRKLVRINFVVWSYSQQNQGCSFISCGV